MPLLTNKCTCMHVLCKHLFTPDLHTSTKWSLAFVRGGSPATACSRRLRLATCGRPACLGGDRSHSPQWPKHWSERPGGTSLGDHWNHRFHRMLEKDFKNWKKKFVCVKHKQKVHLRKNYKKDKNKHQQQKGIATNKEKKTFKDLKQIRLLAF